MKAPKVGFLVDNLKVEKYVAELFDECNKQLDGNITIICNTFHNENKLTLKRRLKDFGLIRSIHKISFNVINQIEHKILIRKHGAQSVAAFQKMELPLNDHKRIELSPLPSRANLRYAYNNTDIEKLKAEKFDLIIRGEGRGILHGEILNVAKNGIISFHYGDNRQYRGVPAGFWEVYFNNPKSELIIQVLDNKIDDGSILARQRLGTAKTHLLNCHNLFSESKNLIKDILKTFKKTGELPKAEKPSGKSGKLFTTPTVLQTVRYLPTLIKQLLTAKPEKTPEEHAPETEKTIHEHSLIIHQPPF